MACFYISFKPNYRKNDALPVLIHTGQHYDPNMSDVFFDELNIPKPDIHLGIGSGTHAEQTGNLMIAFERLCLVKRPDMVLVVGDVNATVACSLTAAKLGIPVAHVEAGLRSGDRSMPEELNRIVTDNLSDLLFTTCRDADENLKNEGIPADKIHFAGNVMVDTLLANIGSLDSESALDDLCGDLRNQNYAVLTMHRPSNVDSAAKLKAWVYAFEVISENLNLVCPLHPRTQKRLGKAGLLSRFQKVIKCLQPLGYLDFLTLIKNAKLVITDSGGLQEETTVLGVPCLTIRDNTERPITILRGTNELIGTYPADLVQAVRRILDQPDQEAVSVPDLWDGNAARRIVHVLESYFKL